jgi:hypothetical protein
VHQGLFHAQRFKSQKNKERALAKIWNELTEQQEKEGGIAVAPFPQERRGALDGLSALYG